MNTHLYSRENGEENESYGGKRERRKRRRIFRLLFALIILAALAGYAGSAWLKENGRKSEIIIAAPFPGMEVFINGEAEGSTGSLKQTLTVRRPAGQYAVLVSKEGFWPWMKNISLEEKEALALAPFLVPREVPKETIEKLAAGKDIAGNLAPNPKYAEVLGLFRNFRHASSSLSLTSAPDTDSVFLPSPEIQTLLAQIPLPSEAIKNADFFPGRRDVLIVAARNQIFAVEAGTTTEPRNFQPIYSGTDPDFIFAQEKNTLYIKDGEILSLIKTIDFAGR